MSEHQHRSCLSSRKEVVGIVGDASIYGIPCAKAAYGLAIIEQVVAGKPGMPRYEDHEGNELGVIFDPEGAYCDTCFQPVLACTGAPPPSNGGSPQATGANYQEEETRAMMQPVYWPNEDARQEHSGKREKVTVVQWDYAHRAGQARTAEGQIVAVYLASYAQGDLTIGRKPIEHSSLADATALNQIKHRVREVTRALDATRKVYPASLEASQVKHEIVTLCTELRVHGLWPADVCIAQDALH